MGKGQFDAGREDYDNLPDGDHIAQITKIPLGRSKNGNDMIAMRWSVIAGDNVGMIVRDWIVLMQGKFGYGKLGSLCRPLGVKGSLQDPKAGLEPHEQASLFKLLLGRIAVITTEQETYEDNEGEEQIRTKVVGFKAVTKKTLEAIEAKHNGLPPLPEDAHQDWDGNELRDSNSAGIPF